MEMIRKIKILYAGGVSFSVKHYDDLFFVRPANQRELEDYIGRQIIDDLKQNLIKADYSYFNGDHTGANLQPSDWNDLAQEIAQSYDDYDGFVILHGQDTLSWASSQLSYTLQNLAKPVIFTDGHPDPSERGHQNTQQMIITASHIAAFSNISEVSVLASNGRLIKGVDCILRNANHYADFISRNGRELAHIGTDIQLIPENMKPKPTNPFYFEPLDTSIEVSIYNANPLIPTPMQCCIDNKTAGVVMIVEGQDAIALEKAGIEDSLLFCQENDIPVVAVIGTSHGYIDFSKTDRGERLIDLSVLSGGSMTLEAASTKLKAALSRQIPYQDIAEFMQTDLFQETKSFHPVMDVPTQKTFTSQRPNIS
jgi:L-asparaginase